MWILLVATAAVTLLPVASAANVSYTLKADFNGWNFGQPGGANSTLLANVADSITVTIQHVNSIHNFAVYDPGYPEDRVSTTNPDALQRSATVSSSVPTASVTFSEGTPGLYEYYCEIHPFSMHGKLDVRSANRAPTLSGLGSSPAPAIPGQEVAVTGTAADADGDVLAYTWAFGDGAIASGSTAEGGGAITAVHAYMSAGIHHATLTVNDGKGGVSSSSVDVTIATPGLLRATTSIDLHPTWGVQGKILVDGIASDEWGLAWVKIAPGRHTVAFTDVQNLGTPASLPVDVVPGLTSEVNGMYRAYGWLRVVTDPPVAATVSVDSVPRNDWGMWMAMPPGSHDISFGSVAGFRPPPPQTVNVVAEQLTAVTGSYVADSGVPGPDPASYGLLRVTTSLSDGGFGVPSQIRVDGVPRDEWGLAWLKIAPGTHTVSFSGVQDLGTPPAQTVNVLAGQTTAADGKFEVYGWLRVTTDPPSPGTVFVDNEPRNDWGMWQAMRPGQYTVAFGPVPGYATPGPQIVTVKARELTVATGSYALLSTDAVHESIEESRGTPEPLPVTPFDAAALTASRFLLLVVT